MEKNYAIISEMNGDFTVDLIKQDDLIVLPMRFMINGKEYLHYADEREMKTHDFYEKVKASKELPHTSAANETDYVNLAEPILKEGRDVLIIAFDSALSACANNAKAAATHLQEKYPDRKIIAIDSLAASMGEALYTHYAAMNRAKGMSIEENAQWLEDNKLRFCHLFTVQDLYHLKKGGRLSAASALLGTLLAVKPLLHVSRAGKLVPYKKSRGRKGALKQIVEDTLKYIDPNEPNQEIFISHGDCLEDALLVQEELKERLGGNHKFTMGYIGPVIGTHSGQGTLAVYFLGTDRLVNEN